MGILERIPTELIETDIAQLQAIVSKYIKGSFTLPEADLHLIGISGGIDSTAVAVVMRALFPNQHFIYVFTDTGCEAEGTYEAIANIEKVVQQPVHRIQGKATLYEAIEQQGGFLPAAHARFCTRISKIVPLQTFMEALKKDNPDATIASYVGIRADESERTGATYQNGIESHFPLQHLGLTRRDVFAIANESTSIPTFYLDRSRSGCSVCIFSRRAEIIAQWRRDPQRCLEAAQFETLPEPTLERLKTLPTEISAVLGVGRNWLTYPVPGEVTESNLLPWERVRDFKPSKGEDDLFGHNHGKMLYCAVEYTRFWNGYTWENCFQRFVTYSSSLAGLQKGLKFHWKHRLDTREVLGEDEQSLTDDFHIGLFQVRVDNWSEHFPDVPASYTWQSDRNPLLAIRKTMAILDHILLREGILIDAKSESEQRRQLAQSFAHKLPPALGEILWCGMFDKPEAESLEDDYDIEEAPTPCIQCSR